MSATRRRRPAVLLVARREILVRLRSRVFVGRHHLMTALLIGIAIASLFAGRPPAVQVGFNDGSQALERTFMATATAWVRRDGQRRR